MGVHPAGTFAYEYRTRVRHGYTRRRLSRLDGTRADPDLRADPDRTVLLHGSVALEFLAYIQGTCCDDTTFPRSVFAYVVQVTVLARALWNGVLDREFARGAERPSLSTSEPLVLRACEAVRSVLSAIDRAGASVLRHVWDSSPLWGDDLDLASGPEPGLLWAITTRGVESMGSKTTAAFSRMVDFGVVDRLPMEARQACMDALRIRPFSTRIDVDSPAFRVASQRLSDETCVSVHLAAKFAVDGAFCSRTAFKLLQKARCRIVTTTVVEGADVDNAASHIRVVAMPSDTPMSIQAVVDAVRRSDHSSRTSALTFSNFSGRYEPVSKDDINRLAAAMLEIGFSSGSLIVSQCSNTFHAIVLEACSIFDPSEVKFEGFGWSDEMVKGDFGPDVAHEIRVPASARAKRLRIVDGRHDMRASKVEHLTCAALGDGMLRSENSIPDDTATLRSFTAIGEMHPDFSKKLSSCRSLEALSVSVDTNEASCVLLTLEGLTDVDLKLTYHRKIYRTLRNILCGIPKGIVWTQLRSLRLEFSARRDECLLHLPQVREGIVECLRDSNQVGRRPLRIEVNAVYEPGSEERMEEISESLKELYRLAKETRTIVGRRVTDHLVISNYVSSGRAKRVIRGVTRV